MNGVNVPADGAARAEGDSVTPQEWYDLILRRCGLTFRHIRTFDVIGIVREQMRARGIDHERAYFDKLAGPAHGAEWGALVERLTNHETSFFRHPPSFEAVRTRLLPELRERRPPGARLSIWSAGCSTGQEAYSLAMTALDDAPKAEFRVWGGDISHQAIKAARRGRYNHRAVAMVPDQYRDRFLRKLTIGPGGEYEVADEVRQRVLFMAMNLLEPVGLVPTHDIIFCHNVLIYLSPAAVTQAVTHLASCLTPGGFLLLGPGEAPHERPAGLEPLGLHGVRAFQRCRAKPLEGRA